MNNSLRHILSILILGISLLTASASGTANVATTPLPLPSKHYKSVIDTSEELIKRAYESVRENSPFALLDGLTDNDAETPEIIGKMKDFAHDLIGKRYRLGASGPMQFDCSGFVGYVFRSFGFDLSRDSRSQYLQGEKVDNSDLKPGDLLFFSSRTSGKGKVGHVGMVVDVNDDGSCRFIHASSSKRSVVYQNFPDNGYYSKHYIGAKRIIGV